MKSYRTFQCVICLDTYGGFGNNPAPLRKEGRCCDLCHQLVIAHRVKKMRQRSKEGENPNVRRITN
jgi:hypothetical protein